jgi:hypothetical protein
MSPVTRPEHATPQPDSDGRDGRTATAIVVLGEWYAAHPSVRRLWAIRESKRIRVIVTLEPTPDSDDLYPAWLANGHAWAHELQIRMEVPVHLEVMHDPALTALAAGIDGVLVAELLWRDPSTYT